LTGVQAPTLLIVGGRTRSSYGSTSWRSASCAVRDLVIIDGATHLFEEPGALDEVARLAGEWFVTHL